MAQRIRRGDMVQVTKGKDRGRRGRVQRVNPAAAKVVVEGLNMATRHRRPDPRVRQAGRVKQEMPLYAANVRLVCDKCERPTRVAVRYLEDGSKTRMCKRCQEVIG